MTLTLEQILAAQDKRVERVPAPEWGGDVYVRTLTSQEGDLREKDWFEYRKDAEDARGWSAHWAAWTLCDESGAPLLKLPPAPEMVRQLADRSESAVRRVAEMAYALNRRDVEEAAKNSASGPSISPGSA